MAEKIELYKEIHLDSWQDFVKKLMPGEEYHHLLKHCVWRGQRRKAGEKNEDKELRASYFRAQKDCFEAIEIQPGNKTYVPIKDKYEVLSKRVYTHLSRLLEHQNLSCKEDLIDTCNICTNDIKYYNDYAKTYSTKKSTMDIASCYPYDLRAWIWPQHYGVKTPLLDWTKFPFYALLFAYQKENIDTVVCRDLFALNTKALDVFWVCFHWFRNDIPPDLKNKLFEVMLPKNYHPTGSEADMFKIDLSLVRIIYEDVKNASDNARVTRQGGVFTSTPSGLSIEEWLRMFQRENIYNELLNIFEHIQDKLDKPVLYKFILPESADSREDCLIYLNSMNVNNAMIYPDFEGFASAVNTADELNPDKISKVRLY
jgi:hypothetical protein